jgi:hypothetical protein
VAAPRYKVVETMTVTDEEIEVILNRWTAEGWTFEAISYAMREASRRPAMAFVIFTRPTDVGSTGEQR